MAELAKKWKVEKRKSVRESISKASSAVLEEKFRGFFQLFFFSRSVSLLNRKRYKSSLNQPELIFFRKGVEEFMNTFLTVIFLHRALHFRCAKLLTSHKFRFAFF